jgi:hypothetical protein
MAAILLFMGAAEADDPDDRAPHSDRDAMGLAIDQAIDAVAEVIEPIVLNHDAIGQIHCPRQRDAVLGDVGGVLGRIELDVHGFL